MLTKYNLKMPHAVFSGEDALEKICDIFAENHVKRLAVFSDKGIEGAGLFALPAARKRYFGNWTFGLPWCVPATRRS